MSLIRLDFNDRASNMDAFDALGPKARKAINESVARWSPLEVMTIGVLDRGWDDATIARNIAAADVTVAQKQERERIEGRDVWHPDWRPNYKTAAETAAPRKPPPRRGSKAWVEAVMQRLSQPEEA